MAKDTAEILAGRICTINEKIRKAQRLQERAPSERAVAFKALQRIIERERARLDEDYTLTLALGLQQQVWQILNERGEEAI